LYRRSIENRKSYEYRHKEVFEPDRILFIDGGLELRRSGERSFHEALIHPAMFAHPNPKRVAVIGGGSGAHVREILKHKTVEKVVVIQGDEEIVNINKDYFPEFSDCASFNIDNENCWDDSRVEMVYSMFKDWLEEKFKEGNNASESSLFDVIIIDDM
jgi:spermidine synthase